jgi:hypothetical protein
MTVNFPTSFDDEASLFGDVDAFVIATLNGAINDTVTALTFNETTMVDNLDVDTELIFQGQGQGPDTFTGVLDDITIGGTYVGHGKLTDYRVEIDGTGTPDTFKWSNDGGATFVETGVNCVGSGSPYTLEEGITVYWAATTGHTLADRWDWEAGFEIVRIDSHGATGVLNVTRAFNGSTAQSHVDDAQATQDPTAYDFTILREALVAAQKFKGLVGLDASKSATPAPGNVYVATDTSKVYICFIANTWETFNRPDHGDYAGLGADDHTQYHTDARKDTWHTALPGDHITTIAHDHRGSGTQGNPIEKFSTGLDSAKGTPTVVGQVYYGYDANNLYFSNDGAAWTRYTAMPKGTIMFFDVACPTGWTAVSALDAKFVKQADAAEWTGLDTAGADTHVHEMQDVITHSHSVAAQTGITSTSAGSHQHNFDARSGTGGNTLPYYDNLSTTGYINTNSAGSHTHTITIAAYTTEDSGSNPANTDSASSHPAYYKLRACKKD